MTNRTEDLKVAVIGMGRIGELHAQNILRHTPEVSLVAISDPLQAQISKIGPKERVKSYLDYRKMLQIEQPDAVLICTPNDTHFEIIEACCSRGIHIFCEKPLETRLDTIDQIQKLVDKFDIHLQVGFNRRFDSRFAELAERVRLGEIGDLRTIKIISRDPAPPPLSYIQSSGGLYVDMTIHDFDMSRFVSHSNVSKVSAVGGALFSEDIRNSQDIDTTLITLVMENDTLVSIDNCRHSKPGYDQRLEVFGSEGMLQAQNKRISELVYHNETGRIDSPPFDFFLERYEYSYVSEIQEFFRCLLQNEPPSVSVEDAKHATAIAIAAKLSLEEERIVKMSEIIEVGT